MIANDENESISKKRELEFIQHLYMTDLHAMDFDALVEKANKEQTVTLYHGTTTEQLNSILQEGIQNFGNLPLRTEKGKRMEDVTYLTDKWHYLVAVKDSRETNKISEKGIWDTPAQPFEVLPCYIECRIPKEILVLDEDFFMTTLMEKKVENAMKKDGKLDLDPMECLAQCGTVGVMGQVPPENIVSFTILGDPGMASYVMDEGTQYQQDYLTWSRGEGKGKTKNYDLIKKERNSRLNATWLTADFPENAFIENIEINAEREVLSLKLH